MATRCPQCQAEVSVGAAFCAVCGAGLAGGGSRPGAGPGEGDSPSLFELPASKRGRWVRVATVLTLDAVLAGAGVAMILSYAGARAEAARPHVAAMPPTLTERPTLEGEVEVAPPRVVRPGEPRPEPSTPGPDGPGKPKPAPTPVKPGDIDGGDDEGEVLGGIARRPDAGVPIKPPPPPPGAPDAGVAITPPPPPPDPQVDVPDAALPGEPPPPPDPTAEEQSLASGVQRTVEAHMGQVRRCWENAAKSSADTNLPEGLIEVEFAVRPSGDARNVQIVQNVTGSDQLGACVVALVSSWQFPTHGGDPVVFVWPFLFKASK